MAGSTARTRYELCFEAIRRKQQLTFLYEEKPRIVCPHVLGHTEGEERLFAYQIGGMTSKGAVAAEGEWRCFILSRARNLHGHSGAWRTGSSHIQRHQCIADVDIDVNPKATQKFSWRGVASAT
jgi:hypothetical protein